MKGLRTIATSITCFLISLSSLTLQAQAQIELYKKREACFDFRLKQVDYKVTLRYYRHSRISGSIYTAQGSLSSKTQGSVPIVAFFSPEKTSLYKLKDSAKVEGFLKMESDCQFPWECEESFHNYPNATFKIVLQDAQGMWVDQGDTSYFSTGLKEIKCFENLEMLEFDGQQVSLKKLYPRRNFEVLAQNQERLILKYRFTSNPYHPMGRCGAGEEHGFTIIHLDDEKLERVKDYILESCYRDIYFSRKAYNRGQDLYYEYLIESEAGVRHLYFSPSQVRISDKLEDIL